MQPLDRGLNSAILAVANRLFPSGFDVSDDAPQTYKQLCDHLNSGERMVVYRAGSEDTIYACQEVNWAFRAWHDWCHWKGGHDFSVEGEKAVFQMQADHLLILYGDTPKTWEWIKILHAEVVGQRLYYEEHKQYVSDQRSFILGQVGEAA